MTVLVTGARGAIARSLIRQLLDHGTEVRAASRAPENTPLPEGVQCVLFDPAAPETLAPALEGVDKVFLYAGQENVGNVVDAAKKSGVEHIVLLSSAAVSGPDGGDNEIGRSHRKGEVPVEESGIPWTFVRPAMFATNALWWRESIVEEDLVRVPYPDAQVNPIHEGDIAKVAFTALTQDGHEGKAYLVDGPGHLTQRRQIELIGEARGKDIAVEDLPRAVAEQFMPVELLDMLASGEVLRYGGTSEAVTGEPARTFEQWAADHADDFR
ncbi:SDR family oxidoreductase [Salininema proteolyticum]|uniref:SDR family oxidoreductase n=1 Tax=Salininema proteolyticum TaxID=1607685 RepID=A0ABV8TTP0_9ACTN